jgi:hypothetical protein
MLSIRPRGCPVAAIRSLGDWDKLGADMEAMRERAREAGFNLTFEDVACPCCLVERAQGKA